MVEFEQKKLKSDLMFFAVEEVIIIEVRSGWMGADLTCRREGRTEGGCVEDGGRRKCDEREGGRRRRCGSRGCCELVVTAGRWEVTAVARCWWTW